MIYVQSFQGLYFTANLRYLRTVVTNQILNYELVKKGHIGGILVNVQLIDLQNENYIHKYRPICGLTVCVCVCERETESHLDCHLIGIK